MKVDARLLALVAAVLLAGCQSKWPSTMSTALPGPVSGTSLEGGYRWISVDGRNAPREFPIGSGTMIVYGTLDLRDVQAAEAGTGGRYALRFTMQPRADTARVTGTDGRLAVRGDTLFLTPDGGENAPVRFRYSWRSNGQQLALTDTANHVWVYVRR